MKGSKAKPLTHCFIPNLSNNDWTIRRRDDGPSNPAFQCIMLEIDWFYVYNLGLRALILRHFECDQWKVLLLPFSAAKRNRFSVLRHALKLKAKHCGLNFKIKSKNCNSFFIHIIKIWINMPTKSHFLDELWSNLVIW